MRKFALSVPLVMLAVLPAAVPAAGFTVTAETCARLLEKGRAIAGQAGFDLEASSGTPGDESCSYADLSLTGTWNSIEIARLRIGGDTLLWAIGDAAMPTGLSLRLERLSIMPMLMGTSYDYVMRVQARTAPHDLELVAHWDPASKVATLDRLRHRLPNGDEIRLSATARNVDLSTPGAMQMAPTSLAVTALDLTLSSTTTFEYMVLPIIAGAMSGPEPSTEAEAAAEAERLFAEMAAGVADLPDASFPAESRHALVALIQSLPHPRGAVTVSMASDEGVGAARFSRFALFGLPTTMAEAAPLFQGARFDIGWTPAPPAPAFGDEDAP